MYRACTVIRKAIADAVLAGDFDEASGDLRSGGQRVKAAGSFRRGTAVGSDNWPLHEYAKVYPPRLTKRESRQPTGSINAWYRCSTSERDVHDSETEEGRVPHDRSDVFRMENGHQAR